MTTYAIAARNPLLVIVWSFGLFMLMHGHQYVASLLVARRSGRTFDDVMSGRFEDRSTLLLRGAVAMLVGLPLIWLSMTLLWRRPLAWMGLGAQPEWLLLGLAVGLVLPVIVVGVLRLLHRARISRSLSPLTGKRTAAYMAGVALMAVFAGVSEEVVFRAMAARELSLVVGWGWAILISGMFFGVVHLLGQYKTLTMRKTGAILVSSLFVSFLFTAMYIRSASLWLPIGFHIAWNASYTAILGLRMSGEVPDTSLLQTTVDESSWVAGGAAGMEASLPAIAAYTLVALLFVLL
jgi:membrane protease YdiL (CAAX protease family)